MKTIWLTNSAACVFLSALTFLSADPSFLFALAFVGWLAAAALCWVIWRFALVTAPVCDLEMCEGCEGAAATCHDSEGIPLCAECAQACEEVSAAADEWFQPAEKRSAHRP